MRQSPGTIHAGEVFIGNFRFKIPFDAGEYSLVVGFAEGFGGCERIQEASPFPSRGKDIHGDPFQYGHHLVGHLPSASLLWLERPAGSAPIMIERILSYYHSSEYDFRTTAKPDDPLAHLFKDWVPSTG